MLFSQYTAIISLYNVNRLLFLIETGPAICEMHNNNLYIINMSVSLKGLIRTNGVLPDRL